MSEHVERALTRPPVPADLTIAICTIGRDGFLQAAIQSLLETTPSGVRLHIVLNHPDDPELHERLTELVSSWDGPTEVTRLGERLPISASHNTALSAATTPFITFMGDDDLALETRVEELLDIFWNTTPTPAVVGSFCRRVSGSFDKPRFSTNKDYGPTTVDEWRAARDSGDLIEVVFPSAIYRTDLLASVGGFEDRFGSAMDLATFTMLGQDHPVLADPRRSFAHRIHDGSVTSSSPGQHAMRLRYTEACISAIRAGDHEPTWDAFVASEQEISPPSRATVGRRTMSAMLFRQGGASVASGRRVQGLSKVAASAVVSPSTFLSRVRAQATRESNAEPVVSLLLSSAKTEQFPLYDMLRTELRHRSIELRLVIAHRSADEKGRAPSLPWAEPRSPKEFTVLTKTLLWQPGFDIAGTSELIITEYGARQLFNSVLAVGQSAFRTRHCFWADGHDYPKLVDDQTRHRYLRRLTERAHWFFAGGEPVANAAVAAGMAADRITTLDTAVLDPAMMATRFADGIDAALDAPSPS